MREPCFSVLERAEEMDDPSKGVSASMGLRMSEGQMMREPCFSVLERAEEMDDPSKGVSASMGLRMSEGQMIRESYFQLRKGLRKCTTHFRLRKGPRRWTGAPRSPQRTWAEKEFFRMLSHDE